MSLLDRSFSVRQLLHWAKRAAYLLIPAYAALVMWDSWAVRIGGVSSKTSPYVRSFPDTCSGYLEQASGTPDGRTLADAWLLRGRVHRYQLEPALQNSSNHVIQCLGYSIVAGLHSENPADADFSDYFLDGQGDVVVVIKVEYRKHVDIEKKEHQ